MIRDERKRPINAMTGTLASPTDPATWASFTIAAATGRPLGFVFTEDDPYVGIDLDHCRDAGTGAIAPEALTIIERFSTYGEVSPSGTGIHIIGRGVKPATGCTMKTPWGKIECYDAGRYFTMTGNVLPGHDAIRNVQRELTTWYREVWPVEPERPPAPRPAYSGGSRSNEDIIETAERVNGDKVRRLLAGNISGYPVSHSDPRFSSEADAALVVILCGYTADDEQIADIWRSSGLYRKKLDRRDYVDRTIASARSRQTWSFDWDRTTASTGPTQHHAFDGGGKAGDTCPAQLASVRAELAQARQTILVLRERVRLADEREAIQRNAKLGAPRQTAAALATLFREERPKEPGTPTPYRMPLAKLAERTGLSADACSRQLKKLAEYRTPSGDRVLFTDTRDIPRQVNQETGEIIEPHREVWVGPGVDRSAFGYVLAQLAPANAPEHGGKPDRNVCPEHPDAGVLRRTKTTRKITRECAHCHLILDVQLIPVGQETTEHIRAGDPIQHDAFTHGFDNPETADPIQHDAFGDDDPSETDPRPMPQHAASISNHSGGRDLSGKMRHSPPSDPQATYLDTADTGPPPGWEDERRRMYGEWSRGEAAS